jgi:putative endopeptidase
MRTRVRIVVTLMFYLAVQPWLPISSNSSGELLEGSQLLARVTPCIASNGHETPEPCDDFFQYTNGQWIYDHPIPSDQVSWGLFNIFYERNRDALRDILDAAKENRNAEADSDWRKLGDFYASCTDESQINTIGTAPIEPELTRIQHIKNIGDLQSELAHLQRRGVPALFTLSSEQDMRNSALEIPVLRQGGLSLPERGYYLRDDADSQRLRVAYAEHVKKMFILIGDDEPRAAEAARNVVRIETELAKASLDQVELRDPNKVYHKMRLRELDRTFPGIHWERYFAQVGAPRVREINVAQPRFLKHAAAEFSDARLQEWINYFRWQLIHSVAPQLSDPFVEENFSFYGKKLSGVPQLLPRWRRCVEATDQTLGDALGRYYVARYFPPAAKTQAVTMVKNIMSILRSRIVALDWMTPDTRRHALAKLDAMKMKIGYPDKWRDYSDLRVDRGPYVGNVIRSRQFEFAKELAKAGKKTPGDEWQMTPQTINAYYDPSKNEIVFPAGILQPPYYDPRQDPASNYGAIGAIIGHEMTHGFDDQGRKFDGQGNLNNWWTDDDAAAFQSRAECIKRQLDAFEIEPGLHQNGSLVLGEAIADFGGLSIAYAAYRAALGDSDDSKHADGNRGDRAFFSAWATLWSGDDRPDYVRIMAHNSPHPVRRFRANGTLASMRQFQAAFGCRRESSMSYLDQEPCRIW